MAGGTGKLEYTKTPMRNEERFWAKVQKTETCWLWTGFKTPQGYGRFWMASRLSPRGQRGIMAHRYSYIQIYGAIPLELQLDHLCRNRLCVNHKHLEVVSQTINILRGDCPSAINARKTHCSRGHSYDLLNTYFTRGGRRHCRECKRIRDRSYRATIKVIEVSNGNR